MSQLQTTINSQSGEIKRQDIKIQRLSDENNEQSEEIRILTNRLEDLEQRAVLEINYLRSKIQKSKDNRSEVLELENKIYQIQISTEQESNLLKQQLKSKIDELEKKQREIDSLQEQLREKTSLANQVTEQLEQYDIDLEQIKQDERDYAYNLLANIQSQAIQNALNARYSRKSVFNRIKNLGSRVTKQLTETGSKLTKRFRLKRQNAQIIENSNPLLNYNNNNQSYQNQNKPVNLTTSSINNALSQMRRELNTQSQNQRKIGTLGYANENNVSQNNENRQLSNQSLEQQRRENEAAEQQRRANEALEQQRRANEALEQQRRANEAAEKGWLEQQRRLERVTLWSICY